MSAWQEQNSLPPLILFYAYINEHFVVCVYIQEVDAASLLRLYMNYDLLDSAADLVIEYVDALLGKGYQYFGIEVHAPHQ